MIRLVSTSQLKIKAVQLMFPNHTIIPQNCDHLNLPVQPINNVEYCVNARLDCIIDESNSPCIAIENGIVQDGDNWSEVCYIGYEYLGIRKIVVSPLTFPVDGIMLSRAMKMNTTVGNMYKADNPDVDDKDWVLSVHGVSRLDQIIAGLKLINHS